MDGISKIGVLLILGGIVFISGCVEGTGLESIFSTFTTQQEVVVAPNEVLEIEDVKVIPNPPITADSSFKIVMSVVNVGEASEGVKEAREVKTHVYDYGMCKPQSDTSIDHGTVYPGGGTALAEFNFKSPSNKELGYMQGKCTIRYAVEFKYDAYTTSDVVIISREKAEELSRTGETLEINPVQTRSRGPIKIDVNFDVAQPVYEDLVIPMIIKVRNVGEGTFNTLTNPPGLIVELPQQLEVISCSPDRWAKVHHGGTDTIEIPVSGEEVPLINKETPPIRCDLRVKDGVTVSDILTLTVRAKLMGYKYTIYGEKPVQIKPTYEGGG